MVWKRKRSGAPKRRLIRRKRLARRPRRAPSTGGFYIRRRIPAFAVYGSTSIPSVATSANTTVMAIGTPVASASGAPNYFDIPFAMTFYLNQLDTSSDITNIADKYRIVNALIKFCSINVGSTGFSMPWVEYVADHDDNSVPTISQLTQKMGVRTTGFNQRGQLTLKVHPVPALSAYNGVSSAYVVPKRSPYLNSTYDGVPHYAVKGILRNWYLGGSTSATNMAVDIQLLVHAKDLQ